MTPDHEARAEFPRDFFTLDMRGKQARVGCDRLQNPNADCKGLVETYSDMEGERYRCAVCGDSYYLDYEEMK